MVYGVGGVVRVRGVIAKTRLIIERIHSLTGETGEEVGMERARLLEQLKTRVSYVEEKRRLNRINFGDPRDVPNNIAQLYQTLAEAHVLLADNLDSGLSLTEMRIARIKADAIQDIETRVSAGGETNMTELEGRARTAREDIARAETRTVRNNARRASFFKNREGAINQKRRTFKQKHAVKGAIKAGAFALLGAGLASIYEYERQTLNPDVAQKLQAIKEKIQDAFAQRGDLPPEFMPNSLVDESALNAPQSIKIEPEVSPDDIGALDRALSQMDAESGAEVVTEGEVPTAYTIQKGDTLTNILKEKIPAIKELGAGQKQETAIANLIKKLSPSELSAIGVGANPDKIVAGKSLNLKVLNELIEKKGIIKK